MVRQCVVCKKLAYSNPGLIFRRFPVKPERRQKWISILELENQHVIKYAQICANHFDRTDIIYTQRTGRKQIRPDADPQLSTTLFTESLSYSSDSSISDTSPQKSRSVDADFESMFTNPDCPDLPEATDEQNYTGSSNLLVKEETGADLPTNFLPVDREVIYLNDNLRLTNSPTGRSEPESEQSMLSIQSDLRFSTPHIKSELEYEQNTSSLSNVPRLIKIGTVTNLQNNFLSHNQVMQLNESSRPTTTPNIKSELRSEKQIPTGSSFPQLVKIGTVADLPSNFLTLNEKVFYLNETSGLTTASYIKSEPISQESTNLPSLVKIGTTVLPANFLSSNELTYFGDTSRLTRTPNVISQGNVSTVPKIVNVESIKNVCPDLPSSLNQNRTNVPVIVNVESIKNVPPDLSWSLDQQRVTPRLMEVSSIISPENVSNVPKIVTVESIENDPLDLPLSLNEKNVETIRELNIDSFKDIPAAGTIPYEEFHSGNDTLSDSTSTDTASEIGDITSQSLLLVHQNALRDGQTIKLSSEAASITEEQLIEMLESESPLLTPELMFCKGRKANPRKARKHYFGDVTVNDFKTPEEKRSFVESEKRVKESRKKIDYLRQRNRRLRLKLAKMSSVVNMVAAVCDVSHIKNFLEGKDNIEAINNENASSNDEDTSDEEINPTIPADIDPETYETNVTHIDSFHIANQVQVTFLPGSDTANENKLKKELDNLAWKDIGKSKKIKLLNNTIFMKNKVIEDLKNELDQLRKNMA